MKVKWFNTVSQSFLALALMAWIVVFMGLLHAFYQDIYPS